MKPSSFSANKAPLVRALLLFGSYGAWIVLFRLIALTLVTYFVIFSGNSPSSQLRQFQEISDTYGVNELFLMTLCCVLFTGLLKTINPLAPVSTQDALFPRSPMVSFWKQAARSLVPGALLGSLLALTFAVSLLASGTYRYMGTYFQFEDATLQVLGVGLRALALATMVYCEEYLFRKKIQDLLRRALTGALAIPVTALLFVAAKSFQFDLSWMNRITLFGISLCLGLDTWVHRDFRRGASFWGSLLILFHCVLSLPVMGTGGTVATGASISPEGTDFTGILILKSQLNPLNSGEQLLRWLTGGAGGPLSGLVFQLLLVTFFVRGVLRHKKILLTRPSPWLR